MIRLPAGTYLTVSEYAERAGLTEQAVYKAIWQERLTAYRFENGWLINSKAVIINNTLRSGNYVGVRALLRGDLPEFLRKRGVTHEDINPVDSAEKLQGD